MTRSVDRAFSAPVWSSEPYPRARARLSEAFDLQPGWLGEGQGDAVTRDAFVAALVMLRALSSVAVPEPEVFATPEGGVQFEWTVGRTASSLEFEASGRSWLVVSHLDAASFEEVDDPEAAQVAAKIG